jgi:hypothetical protein
MQDNYLSDEQLEYIAESLGIPGIHAAVYGDQGLPDSYTETDEEDEDDYEFENLDDPDQETENSASDTVQLYYPWPISVVGEPIRHQSTDGSIYIDVTLEFNDVEEASDYQIRIVPA